MARLPRMVLPGVTHHVTRRGNRRARTFFEDGDYALYLDLLAEAASRHGVEIWSYCLPHCARPKRWDVRSAHPNGSRIWPPKAALHSSPANAGRRLDAFRGFRTCHRNNNAEFSIVSPEFDSPGRASRLQDQKSLGSPHRQLTGLPRSSFPHLLALLDELAMEHPSFFTLAEGD